MRIEGQGALVMPTMSVVLGELSNLWEVSQAHNGGIYIVSLRILHLQLFLPTIFMWILEQSQRPSH